MARGWFAAAVLPGVLLLIFTVRDQPAATGDTVQYAGAATSLVVRGTLTMGLSFRLQDQFDRDRHVVTAHPLVLWPPGYPLLLAAVMRLTGLAALPAAAVLNALCFAALLVAVAQMVRRAAGATTALAVTWIFSVTPAVQNVYRYALSEGAFLAAMALLALSLATLMGSSTPRLRASWLAALFVAIAMHLRYTGVLLIAAHAGALFYATRVHVDVRSRPLAFGTSVLAGAAGGTIYLWQRLATLGCAFCEPRPVATLTWLDNVRDASAAAFFSMPVVFAAIPGAADTIASGAILIGLWFAMKAAGPAPASTPTARMIGRGTLALAALYAAGIVLLRSVVEFNALDARLLAPALFPVVLVLLTGAVLRLTPRNSLAFGAAAALLLAGDAIGAARTPWRAANDPAFRQTPLAQYIATTLRDQPGTLVFTPEAYRARTVLDVDAPIYPLPADGLPALRAGEHGIVVIRSDDVTARDAYGAALSRNANLLREADGVSAWSLPAR